MMIGTAPDAVLVILAGLGGFWDVATGRIPNWLTYPCIVLGLAMAGIGIGPGFISSVGAVVVVGGLFTWLFCARFIGGGDVKMVAAVGALKGLGFTLTMVPCASTLAAIMALAILARERRLAAFLLGCLPNTRYYGTEEATRGVRSLPFGAVIGVATVLVLWWTLRTGHSIGWLDIAPWALG